VYKSFEKDLEFKLNGSKCVWHLHILIKVVFMIHIYIYIWLLIIYGFQNLNWKNLGWIEKSGEWKVKMIRNTKNQGIDPHITTVHIRVERSVFFYCEGQPIQVGITFEYILNILCTQCCSDGKCLEASHPFRKRSTKSIMLCGRLSSA
jgi:hypothetical protein